VNGEKIKLAEDSTNFPIPPIRESCVKREEFKKDSSKGSTNLPIRGSSLKHEEIKFDS
jgi:hypothetical protein